MGSVHLYTVMTPVYTVYQCLPKTYTAVGLMYQATESTQSSIAGHPFPPSGSKQ